MMTDANRARATFRDVFAVRLPGTLVRRFLADRRPHRSVMITCDADRAVLAAVVALPGMPLGVLVALLSAATMYTPRPAPPLPRHSNGE